MAHRVECSCGRTWGKLQALPFRRGDLTGDSGLRDLAVDLAEPEPDGSNALLLLPARGEDIGPCFTEEGRAGGHVLKASRGS